METIVLPTDLEMVKKITCGLFGLTIKLERREYMVMLVDLRAEKIVLNVPT